MEKLKIVSGKRSDTKELNDLTKEELIEKIKSLEAHNTQLRNIISKSAEKTNKTNNKKQKPFDFEKVAFRHVFLKFFYLGWDYQGFATQEDSTNTIEYHLFNALTKTCLIKSRETSNYHRCGRTDKGVSAFSQVISIDLRSKFTKEELENNYSIGCRERFEYSFEDDNENEDENSPTKARKEKEMEYCNILNRVLPDNIKCVAWCPVKKDASARFDCKSRTYKYFFPKGNLDLEKMDTALTYLKGTHDFRNFCKMDVANGVVTFVRNITEARIDVCTNSEYCNKASDIYILTITGQAFLWHQIRCIVGVLLLIGDKKEEPEVIKELLDVEKNPRKPEYNIASEIPLNLFDCDYDFVDWKYDSDSLLEAISKLQEIWTFKTIKATMIEHMINQLDQIYHRQFEYRVHSTTYTNCLLQGVKPKRYKKLMERQCCEGLEDRIDHFIKKRRIFVEENDKKEHIKKEEQSSSQS